MTRVLASLPVGERVGLAFSGGLDTSVILKWLQTTYECEVVTFTADIGQGEEVGKGLRERLSRVGRADDVALGEASASDALAENEGLHEVVQF